MSGRHVTAYGCPSYTYKTIANVETTASRVPLTSSKCRKSAAKSFPACSSLQPPGSKTKYPWMTSWYMSGRHVTAYGRPSYTYKTIANVETTANRAPSTSTKCRKSAAQTFPRARSSLWPPGSKTKYPWMTSCYMSGRHVTAYGRPSYTYKTIANVESTANRAPFTSSKSRKSAAQSFQGPALALASGVENEIPFDVIVVHDWTSRYCVRTPRIYKTIANVEMTANR